MFTLAHLSDPHLGPLPRPRLNNLLNKRLIGYINWHSNRGRAFRPEILSELIDNIHAARPDHIAVTGDLVNLALPEEIEFARNWLEQLGKPEDVSVIPGNHDAYVPGALAQTRRHWRDFMTGDDSPEAVVFPFVRYRGPVALVGVNSARATAPFMATGHLSHRQLDALAATLERLREEKRFRIVMLHHPPATDIRYWNQRLVEAEAFCDVIARAGAELILHGHLHSGRVSYLKGPHGEVPVVGVPSASNPPGRMHPAAAFNLYRIGGEPGSFTCHMTSVGFTELNAPASLIADRQLAG